MTRAVSIQSACLHCGTTFSAMPSVKFCCSGCEVVFGFIQGRGLGRYYEMRSADRPVCPVPAQVSKSTYEYCDDPEFIRRMSPDGRRLKFFIEGVNCTACLWLLERLPNVCEDARLAEIDMGASTIEVERTSNGSFAAIARALDRFGYKPHPLQFDESSQKHQLSERRRDLTRIGIAAACTGNVMILAVSLYGGADGPLAEQLRWLSALVAAPVLTFCAWPFYRSTGAALLSRHLNIDVPIVLAILAGIAASVWSLVASRGDIYFDSLSMLVLLLLSSRFVLKSVQNQQFQATNLESELLTGSVKRISGLGVSETVSALSVIANDVIEIDGDVIVPADGSVVWGTGLISRAVQTGESEPFEVKQDNWIDAGSRNLRGVWHLKVENPPGQTRLSGILRETEKASRAKSSFTRYADRIGQAFILVVVAVAAAVLAAFVFSSPAEGFSRALALIIVTCPCVFGIAIPLSMTFAVREAARKGIIVKNGDAIERLWNVRNIFFDKTGTLTTGEMSVLKVQGEDESKLGFALGLEKDERHPVARAISKHLVSRRVKALSFEASAGIINGGVQGTAHGIEYSLKPVATVFQSAADEMNARDQLLSTVGFFENDFCIGRFQLGDQVRSEAKLVVQGLQSQGFRVQLISGDRKAVVESCADQVGLLRSEVHWELTPEDKASVIRNCRSDSVMIGDGANDAAALAAAQVGIAVCGSLDVSLKAADVYLARPNLLAVTALIAMAAKTKQAIRRNLLFSVSFNVFSGTLAVLGFMTPLWAAVLMPLSSLIVLASATWTGKSLREIGERS